MLLRVSLRQLRNYYVQIPARQQQQQQWCFEKQLLHTQLVSVQFSIDRIIDDKFIKENKQQQQQQQQKSVRKMPEDKPKIVFVLGPPGAGKGTQCSKIVENFNYAHLSAGDLLREERAREGSEVGVLIEDCIRNGKIVPVEVTCSLLDAAMQRSNKNKFLIDGFPRNQDNLDGWNRQMADKVNFQFVLFFNCAEDTCVDRCLGRGLSGSGRSDDNPDSLKKRIGTYVNDSLPIIKHFELLGQVHEIDASCNAEEVFEKVKKYFD